MLATFLSNEERTGGVEGREAVLPSPSNLKCWNNVSILLICFAFYFGISLQIPALVVSLRRSDYTSKMAYDCLSHGTHITQTAAFHPSECRCLSALYAVYNEWLLGKEINLHKLLQHLIDFFALLMKTWQWFLLALPQHISRFHELYNSLFYLSFFWNLGQIG